MNEDKLLVVRYHLAMTFGILQQLREEENNVWLKEQLDNLIQDVEGIKKDLNRIDR